MAQCDTDAPAHRLSAAVFQPEADDHVTVSSFRWWLPYSLVDQGAVMAVSASLARSA